MLSTYRLQIFLARDQYLRSSLPHGDQTIAGQLEKRVLNLMLTILARHKKQSDYVVGQSSFPLIALFWLKIGRCRRKATFALVCARRTNHVRIEYVGSRLRF